MSATLIASIISCLVSSVMGGIVTFLVTRWKGITKREKAIREGVKSLLRNQLIEYHDRYTRRGYCPIYAKESARRSYDSYHELGGNGVVTKLFEDIMALPEEEEKR